MFIPAPQVDTKAYAGLTEKIEGADVKMVKMPDDYAAGFDCTNTLESQLPKIPQDDNELILIGHSWGG